MENKSTSFDVSEYQQKVNERYAFTIKALDVLKKHQEELHDSYDTAVMIFINNYVEVAAAPFEDEISFIEEYVDEYGVDYCTIRIQQLLSRYLPDFKEQGETLESYYSWSKK